MDGANDHDSTKLTDVIESISEYLDDDSIEQIVSVYADNRPLAQLEGFLTVL